MNQTVLYIVIGAFFLFIIVAGLAYKKGYIPKTKQWGLRQLEEIKKQGFFSYTKLGDTPDANSFCCLADSSDPELSIFCNKYKIPTENNTDRCDRFNTLSDTYKQQHNIKEDAHLVYNNNTFKLYTLPDGKRMIKNITILYGLKDKLDKLKGVVDSLELEVTYRMLDIQLSNDSEYTHLSKPIINV